MRVAPIEQVPIYHQVALTGSVTAQRSARLSTSISGLVQALHIDAGSQVQAGEVLLQLDSELAALQLASAEAKAKQALNTLENAQRRLREARELIPQRSIAETVVRDLESEVAIDDAALQQARAETNYQRGLLERHTLSAPFAGVVSAKLTEVGEWVSPGQAVAELVTSNTVRMEFPVAEDYLTFINEEGVLHYSLNAQPDKTYLAEVDTIVPVTDPGARTFLLRVLPMPDSPVLQPGMSVRAILRIPAGHDGLVVPRDAILRYPDGRTAVWLVNVVDGLKQVTEHYVQTGLQFGGYVEVHGNLAVGANVVIEGNESLQNGQVVNVQTTAVDVSS